MDLYTLLGLTRAASAGEIDRAYRRLARRYHPGINPGDRTSELVYQQILEVYRILGDVERRRAYDHGGGPAPATAAPAATVSFQGFDFSTPAEGPLAATFSELFADVFQHAAIRAVGPDRGAQLEASLTLSFEDAIRGGAVPLSIVRQERCGACSGDGRQRYAPSPCPACRGAGERRWARGHMVFTAPCQACGGAGQVTSQPCRLCAGHGVLPRSEVVTVMTPPGIEDGAVVVVPGRGHANAGGPTGDLYVRVTVQPHAFFRRDGRDLHVTLPVAVHEAVLGARVDVPTLGEPVTVRIPPGTPSGRHLQVRGQGVPAANGVGEAGDLIVEVEIVLPAVRDARSRDLLREFGRLNGGNVREHLFERKSG